MNAIFRGVGLSLLLVVAPLCGAEVAKQAKPAVAAKRAAKSMSGVMQTAKRYVKAGMPIALAAATTALVYSVWTGSFTAAMGRLSELVGHDKVPQFLRDYGVFPHLPVDDSLAWKVLAGLGTVGINVAGGVASGVGMVGFGLTSAIGAVLGGVGTVGLNVAGGLASGVGMVGFGLTSAIGAVLGGVGTVLGCAARSVLPVAAASGVALSMFGVGAMLGGPIGVLMVSPVAIPTTLGTAVLTHKLQSLIIG